MHPACSCRQQHTPSGRFVAGAGAGAAATRTAWRTNRHQVLPQSPWARGDSRGFVAQAAWESTVKAFRNQQVASLPEIQAAAKATRLYHVVGLQPLGLLRRERDGQSWHQRLLRMILHLSYWQHGMWMESRTTCKQQIIFVAHHITVCL